MGVNVAVGVVGALLRRIAKRLERLVGASEEIPIAFSHQRYIRRGVFSACLVQFLHLVDSLIATI